MIAEAKIRYALPVCTLAAEMGLSASSLSRWRRRLNRGEAAVGRRGPRKLEPLNFSELHERIQGLGSGNKRTSGSGALRRAYAGALSRRELGAMVRAARSEATRHRRASSIMSAGCGRTWHGQWTTVRPAR
jgi:hypothetical protein